MRAADQKGYPTPGCLLKPKRISAARGTGRAIDPGAGVVRGLAWSRRWLGHGLRHATIDGDSDVLAGAFLVLLVPAVRTGFLDLAAGARMIATYTERMTVPPMSDPSPARAPAPAGAKGATAP